MTRVKRGTVTRKRHARLLDKAKGFWGRRKNVFRRASETVIRAEAFAYRGRRLLKRDMRALFITRLSAAFEELGTTYSVCMHRISTARIELNRKMLSQIAIHDPEAFQKVVHIATAQNS